MNRALHPAKPRKPQQALTKGMSGYNLYAKELGSKGNGYYVYMTKQSYTLMHSLATLPRQMGTFNVENCCLFFVEDIQLFNAPKIVDNTEEFF